MRGGSVTEGYLLNGACNRIFYVVALYLLVTRDTRLKHIYDPYLIIGLFQLFMWVALKQVGRNHPIYHEWAKDGPTPEMMTSLPYTSMWRAYKHCIVHHDNGLSFCGDFFLGTTRSQQIPPSSHWPHLILHTHPPIPHP